MLTRISVPPMHQNFSHKLCKCHQTIPVWYTILVGHSLIPSRKYTVCRSNFVTVQVQHRVTQHLPMKTCTAEVKLVLRVNISSTVYLHPLLTKVDNIVDHV